MAKCFVGAVRLLLDLEAVALHHPGEPAPLRDSDHIDLLTFFEDRAIDLLADLERRRLFGRNPALAKQGQGLEVVSFEVAGFGFAEAAFIALPHSELKRAVAVAFVGHFVNHRVGRSVQYRHGRALSGVQEKLSHAELSAKKFNGHVRSPLLGLDRRLGRSSRGEGERANRFRSSLPDF